MPGNLAMSHVARLPATQYIPALSAFLLSLTPGPFLLLFLSVLMCMYSSRLCSQICSSLPKQGQSATDGSVAARVLGLLEIMLWCCWVIGIKTPSTAAMNRRVTLVRTNSGGDSGSNSIFALPIKFFFVPQRRLCLFHDFPTDHACSTGSDWHDVRLAQGHGRRKYSCHHLLLCRWSRDINVDFSHSLSLPPHAWSWD